MMQDLKKHKIRKQKKMKSKKMRKPTENQGKNTRKKEKRKNPKGGNTRNISITLHLVMIVLTTAWTQMLNVCKVPVRKEPAPTGIMMFHFLRIQPSLWFISRILST